MATNYEVISKKPVSQVEVQKIIENKDSNIELTYREEKVLDHLKKFNKLSITNFEKAKKELIALEIPRLEEEHYVKILDILPKNGTELRAIVSHSGTILVDENLDKILEILKKYS